MFILSDPDKEDNNGLFIIKNDSVYVEEFMDWALNANKGDVDIVESSIGCTLLNVKKLVAMMVQRKKLLNI